MKAGKSPGCDNVTADEMQAAGKAGVDALFKLCEKVWRMERIPTDWSRAIIVPICLRQLQRHKSLVPC